MALLAVASKGVKAVTAALGIVLLAAAHQSSPLGWRGIVPLHSTRADVERLLGHGADKSMGSYYRDAFNAFFIYSTGDCKGESTGGWDVPAGTVLSITVYQKPQPKLSDLGLDENRFKKTQSIGDEMNYIDEEQGLSLEVYQGTVQGFYYFPTRADEKMRCP